MKTKSARRWVALISAVVLLIGACSSSGDSDASSGDTAPAGSFAGDAGDASTGRQATEPAETVEAEDRPAQTDADETGSQGSVSGGLDSLSPADIGRDIVFTAEIRIAVDDVAVAGRAALDAVAPLGGLLFGQETTTDPRPRTILVIKVLPEDFSEALSRLGGLGDLVSQRVSADDVTDRIVDLESRIVTAETSVERLRTLLEAAVGLDDIAALERELLDREQSLEQLRGQLRTIEDAVGLATITLVIDEIVVPEPSPAVEASVSWYAGDDGGRGCPARGNTGVDEGDVVTFCVEITNAGDTDLADIEISDRSLDLEPEDFERLTVGSAELLEPGETWVYAAMFTARADASIETRVTAIAATADGPLEGLATSVVVFEFIDVDPDDSLPGFTDAFGAAVDVLAVIVGVLVIAAGAIVPFLWLGLVAAAVIWFRRRRSVGTTTSRPNSIDADTAPPTESSAAHHDG